MVLKGLPWSTWRRDFFPTSLILGVFVVFALLAIRVVAIDSPVMGSDEYAYFQTAHFDGARDQLFQLDANMQRVDNKVYPWLYKLWATASAQRVADVGRLFNAFLYSACALLLFAIFQRLFDRRIALISALLYLVFPFSIYATMLLPEVEFQFAVYALVATWVFGTSLPSWRRILVAAAVAALGYLIKPHALAAVVASAAWLGLAGLRPSGDTAIGRRLGSAVRRVAVFVVATYIFTKLFGRLLDPKTSGAVVSSFYASYLQGILRPGYLLAHIGTTAMYAAGHLWLLCVFFLPAFPILVSDSWAWVRGREVPATVAGKPFSRGAVAMFVLLLVLALVAMVAVFTDAAAAGTDIEKGRLHGRYLALLFPLLLGYAIAGVYRTRASVLSALGLLALWSFALVGTSVFQLYPWDYPDAFGFFKPTPGRWSFEGALSWTCIGTLVVGTLAWLAFAVSPYRRAAYGLFVLATMILAHLQTGTWLAAQSRYAQSSIDAGNAVAAYLGERPAGSGMIATTDRWGQVTYLLAAIDSMQHVRMLHADETLRESTVPAGVQWIVVGSDIQVDLPSAAQMSFGPYRLFLLANGVEWPKIPMRKTWDGKPLLIALANAGGLTVFDHFNAAEAWGRWSSGPEASIVLPVRISDTVDIRFFAWSSTPQGDDVTFQLGDSEAMVHVTEKGADYEVTLSPRGESERLFIRCHHVETSGSRPLGVAIAKLQFLRP
jgi:hypothetical protein